MAGKASRTAELAALARASMHREPGMPGPDDVAFRLLSPPLKLLVAVEPLRRVALKAYAKLMPGGYAFVGARTAVFDDFFVDELRTGATQVVILGAGYDSRAHRFAGRLKTAGARVFEVDAPATSRLKRAKVAKLFGAASPAVVYVEVDFARDSLEQRLIANGYSTSARTAFLWEGVIFYLQAPAVDAVLRFVRERSGNGSAIVFDYLHRGIVEGTDTSFAAQEQRRYVARKGEPYLFGLDRDELPAFLAQRGFTLDRSVEAEELRTRYFANAPAGSEAHRLGSFYAIAVARKSPG